MLLNKIFELHNIIFTLQYEDKKMIITSEIDALL